MNCKNQITGTGRAYCKTLALAVAIAACLPSYGMAAEPLTTRETSVNFDIPAGDLSVALERFSTQSGVQALYREDLIAGKRAATVKGSYSPTTALTRLLAGTGLTSERVNERTFVLKSIPVRAPDRKKIERKETPPEVAQSGKSEEAKDLEKMVVVGSRLGTSPVESAMPMKVITRDQIDRSGAGTIAEMLTYLPEVPINNTGDRDIDASTGVTGGNTNSTTVQMRGLPRGTTLILINGRRAGESATFSASGQFDLSTIPLALVERIEVLPGGASAIYGGDGLAGVINIVLRKDANGAELRFRRSHAQGYASSQASVMWGKTWSKGEFTAAANWSETGGLFGNERERTSDQDYRPFGGADHRLQTGRTANVYSLAGCGGKPPLYCYVLPIESRGPLPGLTSPFATVPADSDGRPLTAQDFIPTQGTLSRASNVPSLRSPEKNYSFTLTGRVGGPTLEAFSELTYSKRSVPAREVPLSLYNGVYGFPSASGFVPATNPFNPFGVDVGIDLYYANTGIFVSYSQQHYRGVLGLRGKLARFEWEFAASHSSDMAGADGSSGFDQVAIARELAKPDSTFNPFVSGGAAPASQEVLRSLLNSGLDHDVGSKSGDWTGYIRGPIWKLPGGEVIALVGAEQRRTKLRIDSVGTALSSPYLRSNSDSAALFAEARIPLIAPREGEVWERMALSGAVRRETGNRYEEAAKTGSLGFEFRPFESLLLRSAYSTAFRPLLTYAVGLESRFTYPSITDPAFNGQRYTVQTTSGGGIPPEIQPETSRTFSFGAVYRPSSDWSASVTHWNTRFVDRISAISPQVLVDNESYYPHRVFRDSVTGRISSLDARQINISSIETSGVDLTLESLWTIGAGDLHASLQAAYTYKYNERLTDSSPLQSGVNQLRSGGWSPKWKIIPRLSWDHPKMGRSMLTGRYVSNYRDSLPFISGPLIGQYQELGGFWMFDFNVDVSLGKAFSKSSLLSETSVSFGSRNLFNKLPEFCVGCAEIGYDRSQYDIVGRTIYVELRKSL